MYKFELEHYIQYLSGERICDLRSLQICGCAICGTYTCGPTNFEICVQKSPPCNELKDCSILHIDKFVQGVAANEMIFFNTYGNNKGNNYGKNAQMCVKERIKK
jgi:hypothetical protein